MQSLFVTGCYRSGTTFLQKLLLNHPDVFTVNQPIAPLFFHLKEAYYRSAGYAISLPLSTCFGNEYYDIDQFTGFLDNYRLQPEELETIRKTCQTYQGNFFPEASSEEFRPASGLKNFYDQFNNRLIDRFKPGVENGGIKEILCEAFIPYFLQNGVKVLLILRDPRDMIVSLNYGKGMEFTGRRRPTLFNIRNWRKSVAFAIKFHDDPGMKVVKYEDLIDQRDEKWQEIQTFLNVPETGFPGKLKDEYGDSWVSNSSFRENKHASCYETLGSNEIHYLNSLCYGEMKWLGYTVDKVDLPQHSIISNFKEPFEINHRLLAPDYSVDPRHVRQELQRLNILQEKNYKPGNQSYFVFEKVYQLLKKYY